MNGGSSTTSIPGRSRSTRNSVGRRSSPSIDVHHHDVEVGHVARRHEPLLGAGCASRRPCARPCRRCRAGVGAGAALGDRIGVGALAAQRRLEVALDLLRRAAREHVVAAAHVPPDAVGVAAELLLHEHLLEGRPALAAVLDGVVAAVEPRLACPGGRRLPGRERPAGPLGPSRAGSATVDEARGAIAQLALGGGQCLHGRVTLPERRRGALLDNLPVLLCYTRHMGGGLLRARAVAWAAAPRQTCCADLSDARPRGRRRRRLDDRGRAGHGMHKA